MMSKVCPICKTAIKATKKEAVKCITCKAIISEDIQWESKYGYEWVVEHAES